MSIQSNGKMTLKKARVIPALWINHKALFELTGADNESFEYKLMWYDSFGHVQLFRTFRDQLKTVI